MDSILRGEITSGGSDCTNAPWGWQLVIDQQGKGYKGVGPFLTASHDGGMGGGPPGPQLRIPY